MANLTITAANVKPGANAVIDFRRFAGGGLSRGNQVYIDPTTDKWMLADTNAAQPVQRFAKGTVLNDAGADQPVAVQTDGDLVIGAALTAGQSYYLSSTAGAICPAGDLVTGDYPCLVGMAKSTTVLSLSYKSPNAAL